jgi:hypothetical protein
MDVLRDGIILRWKFWKHIPLLDFGDIFFYWWFAGWLLFLDIFTVNSCLLQFNQRFLPASFLKSLVSISVIDCIRYYLSVIIIIIIIIINIIIIIIIINLPSRRLQVISVLENLPAVVSLIDCFSPHNHKNGSELFTYLYISKHLFQESHFHY